MVFGCVQLDLLLPKYESGAFLLLLSQNVRCVLTCSLLVTGIGDRIPGRSTRGPPSGTFSRVAVVPFLPVRSQPPDVCRQLSPYEHVFSG